MATVYNKYFFSLGGLDDQQLEVDDQQTLSSLKANFFSKNKRRGNFQFLTKIMG